MWQFGKQKLDLFSDEKFNALGHQNWYFENFYDVLLRIKLYYVRIYKKYIIQTIIT